MLGNDKGLNAHHVVMKIRILYEDEKCGSNAGSPETTEALEGRGEE